MYYRNVFVFFFSPSQMEGAISTCLFHIINLFWNKRQSYSKSERVNTSAEMILGFQLSRNVLLVMTVVASFICTSEGKSSFITFYSLIPYKI